jgi:hypothetical protein
MFVAAVGAVTMARIQPEIQTCLDLSVRRPRMPLHWRNACYLASWLEMASAHLIDVEAYQDFGATTSGLFLRRS